VEKAVRFLSIDPGGTTGLAIIEAGVDTPPVLEYAQQVSDGLQGFLTWCHYSQNEQLDFVVCESFTLRPSVKFPDLSPVYIIGALEALYQDKSITYQPPSSKPLCDDDVLKRIGMYQVGKPHNNDAIRHGIIYLRNKRHMPTLQAAWPFED
jgi:hypothetical protein